MAMNPLKEVLLMAALLMAALLMAALLMAALLMRQRPKRVVCLRENLLLQQAKKPLPKRRLCLRIPITPKFLNHDRRDTTLTRLSGEPDCCW
jgi:hypothetical protein